MMVRSRKSFSSDAAIQRRADMGMVMVGKSIGVRGDYSRTPTTVVENYYSERELREEFSVLVSGYTARQLSKSSGCTVDAAKMWLAGKRTPNLASAFNMAQDIPVVSNWVQQKIGHGGDAQMRTLRQIVADEVREMVKKPAAPSVEPIIEDRSAWGVRDLFKRA